MGYALFNLGGKQMKVDYEKNAEIIRVLEIYLSDWQHRNQMFWQQNYRFFFAGLVVSLLPYVTFVQNSLVDEFDRYIFHIVGIAIASIHFIIVNADTARLHALSDKYTKMMNLLPDTYQRQEIKDSKRFMDKLFSKEIIRIISVGMPLCIIILNVFLLF